MSADALPSATGQSRIALARSNLDRYLEQLWFRVALDATVANRNVNVLVSMEGTDVFIMPLGVGGAGSLTASATRDIFFANGFPTNSSLSEFSTTTQVTWSFLPMRGLFVPHDHDCIINLVNAQAGDVVSNIFAIFTPSLK